jgi:hypothetical protein
MQIIWILFRSRRIASQPVAIRQVLIAFRVALIGGKSKTFTIYKLLEELIRYVSMHFRAKANAFGARLIHKELRNDRAEQKTDDYFESGMALQG